MPTLWCTRRWGEPDPHTQAIRKLGGGHAAGQAAPQFVGLPSGKNSGNKPGRKTRVALRAVGAGPDEVKLILKGGGCENKNIQYSVPCTGSPGPADRNLEGVRKCILHACWQAQGRAARRRAGRVHRQATAPTGTIWRKGEAFRTLDDVIRIRNWRSWRG